MTEVRSEKGLDEAPRQLRPFDSSTQIQQCLIDVKHKNRRSNASLMGTFILFYLLRRIFFPAAAYFMASLVVFLPEPRRGDAANSPDFPTELALAPHFIVPAR
jgi:hypothetical protein